VLGLEGDLELPDRTREPEPGLRRDDWRSGRVRPASHDRTLGPVVAQCWRPDPKTAKKRPDAIDALVVVTAALHGPAQILTSDPDDISACAATLDHADIAVERI
jgi:hypothetical protein